MNLLGPLVVLGLAAWLAVALVGSAIVGRGIRIADRREAPAPEDGDGPVRWEDGPGHRPSTTDERDERSDT